MIGTSIDSSHLDEHMLVPPVSVRGDLGELLEGGPFRGLDSPRAFGREEREEPSSPIL